MKNDYEFWETYLQKIKRKILKICSIKQEIYIDMHIHSDYSMDGKQSIKQILDSTKEKGFDVIAITDHDTLNSYDEIYKIVRKKLTDPIIIPGIEFTIDNCEYGSQCHMLQLFINPKDKFLLSNVKTNYIASFNRSRIQIDRLKDNKAIQEILKKNQLDLTYDEYISFINNNKLFPEYNTLCNYIMDKFKAVNVKTFDVLTLLEKYNNEDCYEDRKIYKIKRYKKLREKYPYVEQNYYNSHFLLSMLAVREVDDDWWDKPSSGSLSVNSYGQLKISDLNTKFMTFFAHPTEQKISEVENIVKFNKSIIGLEQNIRNDYSDINKFNNLINKYKLYRIIGSDSHDNSMLFYKDMSYFKINSNELKNIIIGDNYGKN